MCTFNVRVCRWNEHDGWKFENSKCGPEICPWQQEEQNELQPYIIKIVDVRPNGNCD